MFSLRFIVPAGLAGRIAGALVLLGLSLSGATAADLPKDFVWRVQGKPGTVYLAGSLHELRARDRPSPSLFEAYARCDRIVLEADLSEFEQSEFQAQLNQLAALPDGKSLASRLDPASRSQLQAIARRHRLPENAFDHYQPWFAGSYAALLLLEEAGFLGDHGVDRQFFDRALREGKPRLFLETAQEQLTHLSRIPDAEALNSLRQDLEGGVDYARSLVEAWTQGDAATVERLVIADAEVTPVSFRRLVVDRNRAWLPRLEDLLTQTNCTLILVGAGHLVGTNGLLELVQKRGYPVVQLPESPPALRPAP